MMSQHMPSLCRLQPYYGQSDLMSTPCHKIIIKYPNFLPIAFHKNLRKQPVLAFNNCQILSIVAGDTLDDMSASD
jgi:hypothetical protein